MLFYRIILETVDQEQKDEGRVFRRQREDSRIINGRCNHYSEKLGDNGCFFLSSASRIELCFGLMLREVMNIEGYIDKFVRDAAIEVININIEEITFSNFQKILNEAARNDYVVDNDEILNNFELDELSNVYRFHDGLEWDEHIILEKSKTGIFISSNRFFTKETFNEELNRIFADEKKLSFIGHPVDYMLETDDEATSNGVTKLLLQALYSVGRLESKRYSELVVEPGEDYRKQKLNAIYKAGRGGTIVIKLEVADNDDEDLAYGDLEPLEGICEIARKYHKDVLTVFCLPRLCTNLKNKIFENMNGCTFVEIREDLAFYDKAVDYLKKKASENKIRYDKKLFSGIDKEKGYLTPELNMMFDEWFSKKLKTNVFKQYKDIETVDVAIVKKKPKGNAYDELNEMIGLDSAKKIIDQALDSYKALKLFKEKGIVADETSHHMIFTGNPGTAKTTVARLFTRIMKENDIIEKGQIVEVGRGDLVGKYVGWTAPIIQRKFKEALGGVLFIDEAYSLVDDRDGSYGDEAINTIVQEMENHRGEVIVIFAGYPDKMESFLRKNPGLRSRIAHHVHFEDYNPDDLCDIAKFIARQKGLKLDEGAMIKIREIMEQAVLQDDFGNGRFVRNVIEKAKMVQNSRLVHMDVEAVTKDDVKLILADDIEMPKITAKEVRKIGFAV